MANMWKSKMLPETYFLHFICLTRIRELVISQQLEVTQAMQKYE